MEIRGLVNDFRGRIVDVGPEQMVIEVSGQEKKIEAFIELMRPYGIRELARTGRIALVRSSRPTDRDEEAADAPAEQVVGHSSL
jgi:acetolactate synthase-1/3 small subunit